MSKVLTFCIAIAIFFGSVGIIRTLQAATPAELRQQIDSHSSTIKQLEEEISKYQQELTKTSAQSKSLQNDIKILDLNNKKIEASLKVTQNKIDAATLTIQQLGLQISDKSSQLSDNEKALRQAIRNLNTSDSRSLLEVFLIYPTLSSFWNEYESSEQFQKKVSDQMNELRDLKVDLETNKSETEGTKKQLVGLRSQYADQQISLEANRQAKAKLLADTKNTESNYQKIIADRVAKKKAFEKELFQFESQLKIAIDPKSVPSPGSGILSWPLDKPQITQYFGNTEFALANSAVYNGNGHNGIDLRASIGTPVRAALSGTVKGTGDTDTVCPGASYGRWALIEHDNGLSTLYAHFSIVKASPGQRVATGEVIGYSGNTGYSTGPHLHFTVYATQGVRIMSRKSVACGGTYIMPIADLKAYLNPMTYL